MWKLIKTEWIYYKTMLLILYCVIAPLLVVNMVRAGFERHLATAMWITVPLLAIAMNNEEKFSRKNPLYTRLPLPTIEIGISRLAVWVPFWISLVILFAFSTYISPSRVIDSSTPWLILTFASSMIIIGSFSSLVLDLRYCFKSVVIDKTLFTCALIIPWILAFVYFLLSVTEPMGPYLVGLFNSPATSIAMISIASTLLILNIIVYTCRRSYLE